MANDERLLIRHAHIVNADKSFESDILVSNGIIRRLAKGIRNKDHAPLREIDARGLMVFPGGVDPHVHMMLPTMAGPSSDNFATGSRAALMGGTTTILDFVTPTRGMPLSQALRSRQQEAAGCMTDYSFHVSPVEWHENMPGEIEACVRAGLPSFKLYMAYKETVGMDETSIKQAMQAAGKAGGMVLVHCEEGGQIDSLRHSLAGSGVLSPHAHVLSRPPETESRAVARAISMAGETSCPLYIVHVSTAESIGHIREARTKGQEVWGEVCPHHLLLDVDNYRKDFELSAPCVLSPPLRSSAHRRALWQALQEGSIHTVGSDHCPFHFSQKALGKDDFRKIANGAGGVEHRMTLLYTFGVDTGRITVNRFAELTSAAPARLFGLYPKKGVIAQGSDADLLLWDTQAEQVISATTHFQNSDINIYEGIRTKGRPKVVIAGGRIVAEDGRFLYPGAGSLLRRKGRLAIPGSQSP